eukprot:jgi/Botrbrau1/23129/Bobra.0243s0059.1
MEERVVAITVPEDGLPAEDAVHSGITVTFQNVTYTVKTSKKKGSSINLLQNISGYFLPQRMFALMGPSGSGKTTLLDVLADTLIGNMTVREMLLYTAELKNPTSMTLEGKRARVEEVISELGLASCGDVIIGSDMQRGISGGQAKRANIGLALVSNPRVLFLDEPTSGLDSYTSNEVMGVVKKLTAETGITVVSTIHSPTPYAFNLFDDIMILLRGRVAYFGPNGPAARDFFQKSNPHVPAFGSEGTSDNLAEWIVDLTTSADRGGKAGQFALQFEGSEEKAAGDKTLAALTGRGGDVSARTSQALQASRATATPFWWAWLTLLKYRMVKDFRDPAYILPRIMDKLLVFTIIATLYLNRAGELTPESVNNVTAMRKPPGPLRRKAFSQGERNDGLYRPITYLTAKMTEELIIAFFNSLVFSCLVYFPTGLRGSFVMYWLVYFVTTSIGIVLAYFIGGISPNMDVANAALPAYVITLLFFVGLLIRAKDQPVWWHWYSKITFLKYGWSAQMLNFYEGTHIPIYGGVEVLDFYSLTGLNKWGQLGYETIFFFAFFVLAWAALAFVRHQKR